MRAPRLNASCESAAAAVLREKRPGDTLDEVLARVNHAKKTWECGEAREDWHIDMFMSGNTLRARLFAGPTPVAGLDHHAASVPDACGGRIPPGYHWDVRPPLAPHDCRVALDPQPTNVSEALAAVCKCWNISLEQPPQGRFRHG